MSNKPLKKGDRKAPWAKRGGSGRRERQNLRVRNLFRIYCEGANTEPEYFKSFPVNPVTTHVFSEGYGRSKTALVEYVIGLLKKDRLLPGQKEYDSSRQNWVVFDYDWKGQEGECHDFKTAIALAEKHGIRVATSNDSFEIWFLLHFQFVDAAMHRSALYRKLSGHLGYDYEKEGKSRLKAKETFAILSPHLPAAIQRAGELMAQKSVLDLCKQNPSTTVHLLASELRKNMRT